MYRVIRGAIHHNGEVYRKGETLPEDFKNKQQYSHVEFFLSEDEQKAKADQKDKELAESKKLETLKAKVKELESEVIRITEKGQALEVRATEAEAKVKELEKSIEDSAKEQKKSK